MRRTLQYIVIVLSLFATAEGVAQRMPERGLVRKGNRQYERKEYERSVESYEKALSHNATSFEAQYDLASALVRTERYDAAEKLLSTLSLDTLRSDIERGEVAYNLGNTQFAQQKYKEALESFRQAMRLNPDDQEAKYNYAYTKRLLQEQEQQQNQQEQNENQEQNQDKEQNENQNKDNQKQNGKDNPQEQENKGNQEQDSGAEQPQEGQSQSGISPEQQEAMLQAIQAEEDKTQDKLKEKAAVVVSGGKNW